jgi:membrane protein
MSHPPLKIHLMRPGFWERFWPRLRSALIAAFQDGCLGTAKGVAYSALLAFFPVLTTLAAILVQVRADAVARAIAGLLYEVVPPGTEDVVRTLFVVHGERPKWILIAGTLLAAFAASGAMVTLMEGFQAVYRLPVTRSLLRERAVAMLLVATTALPLLGASALIVFGVRIERAVIAWFGPAELTGWISLLGLFLRYLVAFAAIIVVTMLMYFFGPERKQRFRDVFPGAVLATALWLITTLAFSWYVREVAQYNVLYGSVGAGLALLAWMYLLAVIVLLGCEYNAVRERALPHG